MSVMSGPEPPGEAVSEGHADERNERRCPTKLPWRGMPMRAMSRQPMRDMASAAKSAGPERPLGACTPSSDLSMHSGEVKITVLPSEAKPAGPKKPIDAWCRARS